MLITVDDDVLLTTGCLKNLPTRFDSHIEKDILIAKMLKSTQRDYIYATDGEMYRISTLGRPPPTPSRPLPTLPSPLPTHSAMLW